MNTKTALNVLGVACILACLVWMNSEALHRFVVSTLVDLPTPPRAPRMADALPAEDISSAGWETGPMHLGVVCETGCAGTSADGDYHTLTLDSSGRLWITRSEDR